MVLAVVLGGVAAGCQDREVVGAVPVKSVLVMAAIGETITVTAEEDPVLAGVNLRIPPGSLARDLTVTIERGGADIVGAMTLPAGPVVIVGPPGTPLSVPARLVLPAGQGTASDRLFIEVRDQDGRNSTLRAFPTSAGASTVLAEIDRFAAFQATRLRPGGVAPDSGPPPPPAPPGP
jgi:hypothetical protein